ncbi:hypothetical protein M8R20_11245 [Pseudomonas sp. R2.Fl]|nr:hypothetical protein [Pseudomonas sp. R2.Fl]
MAYGDYRPAAGVDLPSFAGIGTCMRLDACRARLRFARERYLSPFLPSFVPETPRIAFFNPAAVRPFRRDDDV